MKQVTQRQVTQRQVAEKAGVSRATVSYVLNGKSSEGVMISEETRQRVLTAIEDLGYRPNFQAQNLRSGRSFTIGVLMLDIHNPHFWQYLSGIESEAHKHGYSIMIFHTALQHSEENVAIHQLTQKRIDGAIINMSYGPLPDQEGKNLGASGLSIVDLSSQESPFDHVHCDYYAATGELMEHLYSLGHRRFAFIYGVANLRHGLDRLEPYRAFTANHRIPSEHARVIECLPTQEAAYEASVSLLKDLDRPSAIIAINDYLAIAVLRAASDLGIRVPQDLSVAGYDDIPYSQFTIPRLTTVTKETELGGRLAFGLLLERMNGKTGPVRTERIEASLQIRESTGPAPDFPQTVGSR